MKNKIIENYLAELRHELSDMDKAIIRDALADAEEHLRTALESEVAEQPDLPTEEAIQSIIADYGTSAEIAEAYRTVETYGSSPLVASRPTANGNVLARFFGVYADPRAWGALLYMLISLLTGIIYFTWATTGLSLAVSFALFIFGLPFVLLFAFSIKGIGLLEGRIAEALLGVRMPRRTVFLPKDLSWWQRLKGQLTDKYTWFGLVYMVLQLVFGIVYFTVFVVLISLSLSIMAIPIVQLGFGLPVIHLNTGTYFVPDALLPLAVLLGFLLLTASLHLAKWIGQLHGRYAKFMLVSE
jgi:hypothetical protein